MELTDTEIKIAVKNMAREMVKNAMQFKYGDKVTVDGKYEGVVQAAKDGYYEVRIFDGSRVVGTKVCHPKDITVRNATTKNGKSDAELLRVYDKANKGYDLFPDLTKYGLSKEEEKRAIQLAQQRDRKNIHEIGHERAKRIADDRDARRGK